MQITYITSGYNQQDQKLIVWQRGHYDYEIEKVVYSVLGSEVKERKFKTRYVNTSYEQVMEIFYNLLKK